jgi:hypothetical protein
LLHAGVAFGISHVWEAEKYLDFSCPEHLELIRPARLRAYS